MIGRVDRGADAKGGWRRQRKRKKEKILPNLAIFNSELRLCTPLLSSQNISFLGSCHWYKSCTTPVIEKITLDSGARAHIMAWDQENTKPTWRTKVTTNVAMESNMKI